MPAVNNNYAGNNGRFNGAPNGNFDGMRNGNYNGDHNGRSSSRYNGNGGERGYGGYNNGRRGNYSGYGSGRGDRGQREEFTYQIIDSYGALATSPTGWTKELNRVSWNGNEPKFDIREWSPDHGRMRRGVTFTEEEALELRDLLDIAIGGLPVSAFSGNINDHARAESADLDRAAETMPVLDSGPLIDDICDDGQEGAADNGDAEDDTGRLAEDEVDNASDKGASHDAA